MPESITLQGANRDRALSAISRPVDGTDSSPVRAGGHPLACPDGAISELLQYLGRAVSCFVAGALLMERDHGKVILVCLRPVDDFFLQAVQQRMLRSYRLCTGPAQAIHRLDVTIHGESVCGPYEPPRSFVSVPILSSYGRAFGVLSIASVFPEAFDGEDVCTLSIMAAQVAALVSRFEGRGRDVGGSQKDGERSIHHRYQVDRYLSSILGTAVSWSAQREIEIADALRSDLEAIVRDVLHLRTLFTRLHAD